IAPPVAKPHQVVPLAPLPRLHARAVAQHAGGGNQTLLPARYGAPPPQAHRTFIRPEVAQPKLPMPVSVEILTTSAVIDLTEFGDPYSKLAVGEFGKYGRDGIGDSRRCCAIGDGNDGPPGLTGGPGARHKDTLPQLLHQVEPEFSEEARKAKYSG